MKKILKYIKKPSLIFLFLASKGFFKLMDDEKYLKICYKIKFGKELNLKNPSSFNEKLQWLKINDRKEYYSKLVDKHEVKKYVADTIGNKYLIPSYGVWDNFDEINFDILPNQFVLKPTHTSGNIYICKDKSKLNLKNWKKKINKWIKREYYYLHREWPYKNVKPRILIEKYMKDDNNDDLIDYKFMCFNGKVEFCFVCSDRRSKDGLAIDVFDREWKKASFKRKYRNSNKTMEKPKNFEKMIELAEILAKDIPFIRVDFYEIEGKICFGELTFFPSAGFGKFDPEEWDYKLGEMLDIRKLQEELKKIIK